MFGSCRVGAPQRPPYTLAAGRASGRGSGSTRCGRSRAGCRPAASRGPTACCCSATRSTPTRSRRRRSPSSASRRDVSQPPGEQVADFEEYTRLLPRVVERPGHPLAALDRAEHDDLRRPRRPRRLEHLRGLGARHARAAVVGASASSARSWPTGSTSTSATWRRRSSAEEPLFARGAGRRGRRAAAARVRRTAPTARRRPAASPSTATSAARGWSWSTRAPPACSPTAGATWSTPRSGTWIVEHARGELRPPDHREHAAGVHAAGRIHHLEAWNEAVCAGAWGGLAARVGERLRRALDLEHWPAFQRSFATMVDAAARAAAAAARATAAGHDHRCSAATSTPPTSPRSRSAGERRQPRLPGRLLAVPQPARRRASGA